MKKLILTLTVALAASIATADVVITDNMHVLKEGVDIGAIPDAMLNGIAKPSEVQAALLIKFTAITAAKATAEAASAAEKTKSEALATEIKTAAALPLASDRQAALKALAVTAELTEKQKKRAEILARKTAAEAELAEIDKP